MKFASSFLQYLYGGIELPQPKWLTVAYNKLQALNTGYHFGRFVNCIEVTMLAYKTILENQGTFFPSVTPLPTLPNLIPGYLSKLHTRFIALDTSQKARSLHVSNFSYAALCQYIRENQIPAYSHLIIFAQLNKLPGGHALSGLVVPDESETGVTVYLYDAQGFLPDTWLHPQQFDEFYTIDTVYIYASEETQLAVKTFVDQCKLTVKDSNNQEQPLAPVGKSEPSHDIEQMQEKISEFIRLELFRLEAKLMVSQQTPHEQEKKVTTYQTLLAELIHPAPQKDPYLLTAELFIQTGKIVKNHSYSYNWFDPQSLEHFRKYFEKFMTHQPFQGEFSLEAATQYLKHYIIREITRLSLLNEYNNGYIDSKIDLYLKQLEKLLPVEQDRQELLTVISDLSKIATQTRHWLNFYSQATSASLFTAYLRPIEEQLRHPIGTKSLENDWELLNTI